MEIERAEPIIRLGFFGGDGTDQERQVNANDLASILSNFQRAVYVTVASELRLPSTRNLSTEQRRIYALAVTRFEYGSFLIFLRPEVLALGVQVYAAVLQTIDFIRSFFEPGRETNAQLETIIKSILETSTRSGKDIDFYGRDPEGTEVRFRITEPLREHYYGTAREFLSVEAPDDAWEAIYSDPISFGRGIVRDILTTRPAITVQFLNDPRVISCEYGQAYSEDFTRLLRTFDMIEIVGWPIGAWNSQSGQYPRAIRVAAVVGPDGRQIGNPRYYR